MSSSQLNIWNQQCAWTNEHQKKTNKKELVESLNEPLWSTEKKSEPGEQRVSDLPKSADSK